MTLRHDMRVNVGDWTRPIVRPSSTHTEIVRAALRENPKLAMRLAGVCRAQALRCTSSANACRIESLERVHRKEAADLEAAARILELLT